MSQSHPNRVTVSVRDYLNSDDDDDTTTSYPSSRKYKTGSQTDKDSGRPATTSRKNSLSSDISEEARGVYDYYPKYNESVKISDVTGTCPEFDEAIDVESDKSSIESPRSEDSGKGEYNVTQPDEYGIEMKTYNHVTPGYHASDEDSDDNYHPHQQLYGKHNPSQYGYQRLDEDHDEYEIPTSVEQSSRIQPEISFPRFQVNQDLVVNREVDAGVPFLLQPTTCRSEPARSKSYNLTSSSMEEWNQKKKKSKAIDETDSRGGQFQSFDVNGNPVLKTYGQMREHPASREDSRDSAFSNSVFPRHGGTSEFNLHNSLNPLDSPYPPENKAKIGNKKSKQKREEPIVLAENVENYQGHKDLEELIKFIEQNDIKENQLKKSNATPDAKVEKAVKKAKDKKTKLSVVPSFPSIPKPGDHIVIDIEVGREEDNKTDDMGNSSDKMQENEVIGGSSVKNDISNLNEIEKMVSHKNKAATEGGEAKLKTKVAKEDVSDKRSKNSNNVKKDIQAKVNGFNHVAESTDATVLKESDKKLKDSTKKMVASAVNKTNEMISEKKKVSAKLHIDTANDKKLLNCSKSPSEIKSPLPTSPASIQSEIDVAELDNYIFTDYPVSHVEPEFTVVGKKKKKPVAQMIHSKDQLPFMAGISREFPLTKTKYRDSYSQSVPRSVTPPLIKSRDKNQDFSLSAFPALGNSSATKDKSNTHETRRSSIGDIPLTGETSSLDDSDIASVKSLPAVQAGKLADVVSLRFQKSYAIIAASPKPIGQLSPDASYEEYIEESPEKPKQTVWKGSLTERRHSIGSSPDDGKVENVAGLSESSRQKSGSQEVIKTETNSNSKSSDTANINTNISQTDVSKQSANRQAVDVTNMEKCDKPELSAASDLSEKQTSVCSSVHRTKDNSSLVFTTHSNIVSNSPSNSEMSVTIKSFDLSQLGIKSSDKISTAYLAQTSVSQSPVTFMEKSVVMNQTAVKVRSENSVSFTNNSTNKSSHLVHSSDIRSHNKTTVEKLRNKTVAKIPVNGRKNKSVVVFLDKRDAPSNLDITFGFDDVIEETKPVLANKECEPTIPRTDLTENDKVIPTFVAQNTNANLEILDKVGNNIKPLNHVVNPSDLQAGHVFTQTLLENDKQGGHILPNYTAKSLTDHVNLLNGVVKNVGHRIIPSKLQTMPGEKTNGNRSSVSPEQTYRIESNVASSVVNSSVEKEKSMCSPVVDNTSVIVQENKTVIIYGDALVSRDNHMNNGGDNNIKSIQFILSKNCCGKFNHSEAVTQLRKEWDRVMELKSKNPESVQVYSSQ